MSTLEDPVARALAEGHALLEMGRARDAASVLAGAVAADPQNVVAHTNLALAELNQAHFEKARDAARRALALDAESEWAHRILSIALQRLGRNQEARDEAIKAVELAPESFKSHVVLAEALLAIGDSAGAMQAAKRALQLKPGSSTAHAILARVNLRYEDWKGSEAAAREALRLNPENAVALNNLAIALQRQGRHAEAVAVFEDAARANPRNHTIRQNLLRLGSTRARQHMSRPTRTLMSDDANARRYRPARWDWGGITRYRPWWWIMLTRIPAPQAFAINAALFAALLLMTTTSKGVGVGLWVVILGLTLPFSALRTWRWWRIRHPQRSSWRPAGADDPRSRE